MEFRQLEAFIAVVDWQSFSEAAKRLCLTQPTISSHIQNLEKELKTKLIIRTTKNISITKEGEYFYNHALSILKLRQKALEDFTLKDSNKINLGASTIPSTYFLPHLITSYRKKNPKVCFKVWSSDSLKVIEKILEGSLDLGLVGTKTRENQYVFEPFFQDELVIATPSTPYYQELAIKKVKLEELLKEPFIMREDSSGTKKETLRFLKKTGIDHLESQLNIVAYLNDPIAIKKSIAKGLGVSIISGKSAENLKKRKEILTFSLGKYGYFRKLYLVYLKNKIHSKIISNFINFIKDNSNNIS